MIKTLKNGISINYIEMGNMDGDAILFLHGNGEDHSIFNEYIDLLSNYHLILMDSRCHGESSKGKLSYDLMAEDAYLLLNELNINSCNVIGFSDGAIMGLKLAITHNVVQKLFFIGGNIEPSGIADELMDEYKKEYELTHDEFIGLMLNEPNITVEELKSVKSRAIIVTSENDCIKREHSTLINNSIPNSTMYVLDSIDHFMLKDVNRMSEIFKRELELNVFYEDNQVIVVEKKSGILSQEDKTKEPDILSITKDYLKWKYNKPGNVYLALISRLDRNVSGLMIFAKTSKAALRLNANRPKKSYLAICYGKFEKNEDELIYNLSKDSNELKTYIDDKNGKLSITKYKVLSNKDNLSLVEVNIDTGRFHQIRFSLANINHPIYNDSKYNENIKKDGYDIYLDAYKIEFIHPVTKELITVSRYPDKELFSIFKE